MSNTLKVRDRTTNKVRDAAVDQEDYARLKDYKYLTDKNSKEPFRESTVSGKRQRIALKRDVMGFNLGDPRRVCYVDKGSLFDCRKSNLSTKQQDIKLVTADCTPSSSSYQQEAQASALVLPDLETKDGAYFLKHSLAQKLGQDRLIELVSVDALLGAWAESNGYQKKSA